MKALNPGKEVFERKREMPTFLIAIPSNEEHGYKAPPRR
jgi:hypothetical protein